MISTAQLVVGGIYTILVLNVCVGDVGIYLWVEEYVSLENMSSTQAKVWKQETCVFLTFRKYQYVCPNLVMEVNGPLIAY